MPLHQDVHVDRPLSNYAVEYQNDAIIATQVAPFVPVNNKSDTFMVFTKADKFSLPNDIRGPKDKANQATWGSSTDSYACIDRALRDFLSDAIVGNSDAAIKPEQRTTAFLLDLLLNNWEKRVADLVMTAGNYASAFKTTLAGATQWSSYAGSDPIGVVDTAKDACFMEPNTLIMGFDVWTKLKRHPQLLDLVKGGATTKNLAKVSLEQAAEVFEVERILVGKRRYNSAMKGQTATYARLWGKHVVAAYIDPAVTLENLTAWKTFRWTQISTDAGYKVRRYRDEEIGGGGQYIEAEMSIIEKAVCTDLAYMIIDAVA